MRIISFPFILFTLAALLIAYNLPRRAQNGWLLLLSYIFCISWAWQFALILALTTLFNFIWARRLSLAARPRAWLWSGIGFNLLVLAGFKYAGFFLPPLLNWLAALGLPSAGGVQWLAPLGLSYYVLSAIGYLVDVSRGRLTVSQDWLDFALYMAYFPKLVAGPIEHARTFLPKLARPRRVTNATVSQATTLILVGALRKVVIADTLASVTPPGLLSDPAAFTRSALAVWMLVWVFQIYNDFAGYTDIVRGVSLLFGISLTENFKQPFFARTFIELWNRWHISLSHWLRDYIYFPLAQALPARMAGRHQWVTLVIPPLATMIASGLWHGASWHLLVWGVLQAGLLLGERLLQSRRNSTPPQRWPAWRQGAGMAFVTLTFALTGVPFVFNLTQSATLWGKLVDLGSPKGVRLSLVGMLNLGLFIGLSLAIDLLQHRRPASLGFLHLSRPAQTALTALTLLLILIAAQATGHPLFVYQGF